MNVTNANVCRNNVLMRLFFANNNGMMMAEIDSCGMNANDAKSRDGFPKVDDPSKAEAKYNEMLYTEKLCLWSNLDK